MIYLICIYFMSKLRKKKAFRLLNFANLHRLAKCPGLKD